MRTLMIRSVQVAVVVVLVAVGYQAYRAQREASAAAASLGTNLVLGPAGIARIRLGMTAAEASATGNIRYQPVWPTAGERNCAILMTEDAVFHFSRTFGLAIITAPDAVRTPEGIGAGATIAQVRAAYPKVHQLDVGTADLPVRVAGRYAAPVPGNAAASYRFVFDADRVRFVSLVLDDQGEECTAGK
ncbi:hypothetical protein ODJ79_20085 [Actinoplanes sp. KI2]|uniref:hypothetical protein n=1 Tax=Actinoplanes sp. KI2 TaxID=2983315 RepID=UPI0021D60703|nr:hypothetical protein [Actinoplanes sp. KI2]MCU7726031.1 hypothetical protein [Actinoplanes sp. KI2]